MVFFTVTDNQYEEDAAKRCNAILDTDYITPNMCRRVRNVAPNKEMMCIEFPLKWEILLGETVTEETSASKRIKLSQE